MESEKKLKIIIKESKTVMLSRKEKEKMRSYLVSFIKKDFSNNNQSVARAYYQNLLGLFQNPLRVIKLINRPSLKYSLSLFSIVVFLGLGIVSSAQSSLPGDFLYPIKTNINEKVLGMMIVSNEAKAEYNIGLVQLRLEEMEKLAIENKLDNKVSKNVNELFEKHIEKTKNQIEKIERKAMEYETTAVGINSNLEASLNAHIQILNNLTKEDGSNTSENIKGMLSNLKNKNDEIKKARQDNEHNLSSQLSQSVKASAEGKLKAAEKKIDEVNNFIENKKVDISQGSYDAAILNISIAKGKIMIGQSELELGNYGNAFATFQEAMRIVQETQISVTASISLKFDVSHNKNNDEKMEILDHQIDK